MEEAHHWPKSLVGKSMHSRKLPSGPAAGRGATRATRRSKGVQNPRKAKHAHPTRTKPHLRKNTSWQECPPSSHSVQLATWHKFSCGPTEPAHRLCTACMHRGCRSQTRHSIDPCQPARPPPHATAPLLGRSLATPPEHFSPRHINRMRRLTC